MANAKTYQEYLAERAVAEKETVDELKLREGSKEKQLFEQFLGIADNQNKLLFEGDAMSRHRAYQETEHYNTILFSEIHKLQGSQNPHDRAIGNTALEAIHHYSGKMRGPSIIERVAVEPYYDAKKKEWQPEGLFALAGGIGIGTLIAASVGLFPTGFTFMGALKGLGIIAATGLVLGGVLPPAAKWIHAKLSGNTPPTPPETPPTPEGGKAPVKSHEPPSQEKTNSVDSLPESTRSAAKRESVTILGGGGNGSQPNIPHGNQAGRMPQYGATFFSPTGVLPSNGAFNNYGGYTYGANNFSPTGIPATNRFGQFTGQGNMQGAHANNLNFNNNIGGYGLPNTGYGSVMFNGGHGLNTGVASPFGMAGPNPPPPNHFHGFDARQIPHVSGFAYDESKAMKMPSNSGLLNGVIDEKNLPNFPTHQAPTRRQNGR